MFRWMNNAACKDADPDLFIPPDDNGVLRSEKYRYSIQVAIRMCRTCPVRKECLSDALEKSRTAPFVVGVWGGVWFHHSITKEEIAEIREQHETARY